MSDILPHGSLERNLALGKAGDEEGVDSSEACGPGFRNGEIFQGTAVRPRRRSLDER
jgi:hypothetical protein